MNALITVTAALLLGQGAGGWGGPPQEFQSVATELRSTIIQKGYRKVGVVSRVTASLDASDRGALRARLGPAEQVFAQLLGTALAQRSAGRFQVLQGAKAGELLYDLTPPKLGDPEQLREVAEKLGGMDALVYAEVAEPDSGSRSAGSHIPGLAITCRLVDVDGAKQVTAARESLRLSVAGAAYLGESFELRRWDGLELKNVGLHDGTGIHWTAPTDFRTAGKYDDICRARKHPLDHPGCPLQLSVLVDGRRRTPRYVSAAGSDGPYHPYVALDLAERFAIEAKNDASRDVYVAVFVDGINILGKRPEHPANCRYWRLGAGSTGRFRGWYTAGPNRYLEEEFLIGAGGEGVASSQGYRAKRGQITAVFYTIGMPKKQRTYVRKQVRVPAPPKRPQGAWFRTPDGRWQWAPAAPAEPDQVRTEVRAGPSRYVDINTRRGDPPGLILAAITLRYVTSSELQELEDGHPSYAYDPLGRAFDETPEQAAPSDDARRVVDGPAPPTTGKVRFGVTAKRTARSARYAGVEVTYVRRGYPGTELLGRNGRNYRLVPGRDIITHVNGERVSSYEEFFRAVRQSPNPMIVRVYDTRTNSAADYRVILR